MEPQETVPPTIGEELIAEKSIIDDIGTRSTLGEILPKIPVDQKVEKPSIFFKKETKTSIEIHPNDWLYLYGFCYAPNSEGQGYPSVELDLKGISGKTVFGLDYGEVRLYLSKINVEDFLVMRTGEQFLKPQESIVLKLVHSNVLNHLRSKEVLVGLEFWTVKIGRESIVQVVEERYIDFLHALIDVHDNIDWDIEVSVLDNHIFKKIESDTKIRLPEKRLETRRRSSTKTFDAKIMEMMLFKEKEIAQKINYRLAKIAVKSKIDYLITLESTFTDGWKPILDARYVIGKEKRKLFHQTIKDIQSEYSAEKIMINLMSPKVKFKF